MSWRLFFKTIHFVHNFLLLFLFFFDNRNIFYTPVIQFVFIFICSLLSYFPFLLKKGKIFLFQISQYYRNNIINKFNTTAYYSYLNIYLFIQHNNLDCTFFLKFVFHPPPLFLLIHRKLRNIYTGVIYAITRVK